MAVETTRATSARAAEPAKGKLLTGASIVWQSLRDEGVSTVFGYPGGQVLPLYHALPSYPSLRHILVRHEENAAMAADGYARATGKVGVCVATSGPGGTNLVTGIANAFMDSVPVVAITGQVPTTSVGKMAFQEVDMVNIARTITKRAYFVRHVDELAGVMREAFHVARDGRPGPVLVDVPKDVQVGKTVYERPSNVLVHRLPSPLLLEDREVRLAADLLSKASRPVLLVGHGVILSGAYRELRELAELSDIPIVHTLLGISAIPESHRLSFGMVGMHGHYWANKTIEESDLVIAVGMRFDDRVAGKPAAFAPKAKIVHVDIDVNEMGRNVRVDVPIVGDARVVLRMLTHHATAAIRTGWLQQLNDWKQEYAPKNGRHGHERPVGWHVVQEIRRVTGGDTLIAADVGQHLMWVAQHFGFDKPGSFFCSGGLGSMGYGLPAAIGAKVGMPAETVWAVVGDGGFQMSQPELATLVQHQIPVKIAILNNGYLGMVRQWQQFFFESNYSQTPIPGPDFVRLAAAHDIPATRVTKMDDVGMAIRKALRHDGPYLLDIAVEPEENVYPMVPPGACLGDMILEG